MKFLCVSCNAQMKLIKTEKTDGPSEGKALSVRFECPECLMEIAMLTNVFETQMVTSLGVEIGPRQVSGNGNAETLGRDGGLTGHAQDVSSALSTGKCPFSPAAREALSGFSDSQADSSKISENTLPWTPEAMERLNKIPEFARSMAKLGIEKFALERGYRTVDGQCLDIAREEFEM